VEETRLMLSVAKAAARDASDLIIHANEIENSDKGELAFNSMMRLMDKIDPSYKD